jgi:hypothetical protein
MSKFHRTAISRRAPSLPMRDHEEAGRLWTHYNSDSPIVGLDYGSGRGFDAEYFDLDQYEPNSPGHSETPASGEYSTVFCNYVLNVVPPEDVQGILDDIMRCLDPDGIAWISVRDDKWPESVDCVTQWNHDLVQWGLIECQGRPGSYRLYAMTK